MPSLVGLYTHPPHLFRQHPRIQEPLPVTPLNDPDSQAIPAILPRVRRRTSQDPGTHPAPDTTQHGTASPQTRTTPHSLTATCRGRTSTPANVYPTAAPRHANPPYHPIRRRPSRECTRPQTAGPEKPPHPKGKKGGGVSAPQPPVSQVSLIS